MKNKFLRNLSWIFVGNVLHAVFQFVLIIYAARILTKADYGLINYAASLIALLTAISSLGFNGMITKSFADDEKDAGKHIGSAVAARCAFAVLGTIALQIFVRIANPADTVLPAIILCQSISMLFGSFDLLVYWYRFRARADVVAILRLCAFFLSAAWRVAALALGKGLLAYVIGTAAEAVLFGLFLLIAYLWGKQPRIGFSFAKLKSMLRLSLPLMLSAILITIYGETDKIMLKMMIDNTVVGVYSAALTLAGAISILPVALIEGFRPDILSFCHTDHEAYGRRMRQLYASVFWVCIAYSLFITLLAGPIIRLTYGEAYLDAVPALSLVVWYTAFSYFGSINNLYMVAEGKTLYVPIITITGAGMNVLLNLLLIPQFGIIGAAAASLATQVVTNFLLPALIPALRPTFRLMLAGVCLRKLK